MPIDPSPPLSLVPPPDLAVMFGGGDYVAMGRGLVAHMVAAAGLAPRMRVLDVGCGAGRVAYGLLSFLEPEGSYEGFDLYPLGVEWCAARYHARYPNFRFQHVPVYNRLYYPYGSIAPDAFVFPWPDESFDFVCAASVFTHMGPGETAHYLREIGRVLAPGGGAYLTFFLLDAESEAALAAGRTRQGFGPRQGPHAVADPSSPEDAVAYAADFVRKLHAASGLAILREERGDWRGGAGAGFQDVLCSRKNPA
jgi:SAM-dependent methyltransferase